MYAIFPECFSKLMEYLFNSVHFSNSYPMPRIECLVEYPLFVEENKVRFEYW